MTNKSPENKLYFGDCLQILKKLSAEHPEGFIDLIYIDPPFNSKRNYNILFEDVELKDTKAQKEAFADTWSNVTYKDTLEELKDIDLNLATFLQSLDNTSISKSAVSYLTTMAIRILFMHKVLKETGSFYLHCDPNMSHYLKVVCDLIFGKDRFKSEIVWKRTSAHSNAIGYGSAHDIILYYTKTEKSVWNQQYEPYSEEYIAQYYRYTDNDGRKFMSSDLVGHKGVNKEYEWKGIVRAWRYPKHRLDELEKEGKIFWTKNTFPRYKRFLDEMPGMPLQTIWTDIKPIVSWSSEGLGYPTQKPVALLERIMEASSNKGDLVADFFCGCGTTVAAAQHLKRRWLGVDISHLAIGLIKKRLINTYSIKITGSFEIDGLPKDIASAHELAESPKGRLRFQDWIIETMLGGVHNPRKSADGGWDGHLTFDMGDKKEIVLVEVKSGNVNVKNLREFIQVVNKQKAAAGVLVCFKDHVTKNMLLEAKEQGYYNAELFGSNYDKIQLITVEDLLQNKTIHIPHTTKETFKKAERKSSAGSEQGTLEI